MVVVVEEVLLRRTYWVLVVDGRRIGLRPLMDGRRGWSQRARLQFVPAAVGRRQKGIGPLEVVMLVRALRGGGRRQGRRPAVLFSRPVASMITVPGQP